MNFPVFYISRHFVRTLNVLKLPNFIATHNNKLYQINKIPKSLVYSQVYEEQQENQQQQQHQQNEEQHRKYNSDATSAAAAIGGCGFVSAFSFGLFGKTESEDGEETPEDKLINTIKRSVLCIQREQYDKAEQMLHLALRMAQDIQSKEGITYVYDVMANLAMEREQFKKAEKLFADVMKLLFADGHAEDSPQILHISSKMAHMAQLQGDLDKANQGFQWTLKKIEQSIKNVPNDNDIKELLGLTKNWFGQLLMKQGKYTEAKKYFEEAYACLVEIYGKINEEAITILNNLSVACVNLEEFDLAKKYLQQALELVQELKDSTQEGVLHANLGLIYLREGLLAQAKETCAMAWRIGKKNHNIDAIEQAEYCLDEIKSYTH